MDVPDFHLPSDVEPFPSQVKILEYLHSYADHFNLNEHIKFNHWVVRVRPVESDRWEIIVHDLLANKFIMMIYDAVFVCNGRTSEPFIPNIEGAKAFKGKWIHSHDFRSAKEFQGNSMKSKMRSSDIYLLSTKMFKLKIGEEVLLIGGGPSGVDIAMKLSGVAKHVTLSRKTRMNMTENGPGMQKYSIPNVTLKSRVKRFTADGAEFTDHIQLKFSSIIYATGK